MKVYPNLLLRKLYAQTESLSAAGTGLENVGKTKSSDEGPAGNMVGKKNFRKNERRGDLIVANGHNPKPIKQRKFQFADVLQQ